MKKPLLIVDNDPEIQEIKESLDAGYEMHQEQLEFLKKQHKESWKSLVGVHWTTLEDKLKERNLLPEDYDEDIHHLTFSNGVLYLSDEQHNTNPLESLLGALFK